MTSLFKAVEGIKASLDLATRQANDGESFSETRVNCMLHSVTKALSLLPDDAKTEEEIKRIILHSILFGVTTREQAEKVFGALKSAGVLYVREGE